MTELATETAGTPPPAEGQPLDPAPIPPVDPLAPDADAPFGYTVDRATGARRPKKVPGRPARPASGGGSVPTYGTSPPIEDLKAAGTKRNPDQDRAPETPKRPRLRLGKTRDDRAPKEEPEYPPFRAGPIAKGMNKLYAKAGKMIQVMDPDIGAAILSATRKESDDDVTVGEAWEEIARTNPRIRAFLLKLIAGGAWSQLFMAHAPILLAIMMKDRIRKHIPFMKLIEALLADDEDGEQSDVSKAVGGLTPDDAKQMQDAMNSMAARMGMGGIDLGRLMGGMNGMRQPTVPEPPGNG
jgi:hypothetical protein